MKEFYDVILVGAGLFNAVLATRLLKQNKSILVLERRNHLAGNCYTECRDNIDIHMYGPHVFHTSNKKVWNFLNKYSSFNNFILNTIAIANGNVYNLPFNMNTFNKIFNVITPEEAQQKINNDKPAIIIPKNLEEQAIQLVGNKIYNLLIKGYTEKQWGRSANELDTSIIKRIPLRMTYDNNYFNDIYQGIPKKGYTKLIENMFKGADILLNVDYLKDKNKWNLMCNKVYYSGSIDEYYDYMYGELPYRSVKFDIEKHNIKNYQGTAVVNYTTHEKPYTRIIEHKHFTNINSDITYISKEYSYEWSKGIEPYYPINNELTAQLFNKYKEINNKKIEFVGRLGMYKYFDMDDTINAALTYSI